LFIFNGENLYTFDQLETALVETEKKVFEIEEAIAAGDKYSEKQVAKVLTLSGRCIQALTTAKKDDLDSSTNDDIAHLRQELSEKETNALDLQKQNDALRAEMECQGEWLQNSKAELETLLEQSEQAKLVIARRDNDLREKEHRIKELTDQVENAMACQQAVQDQNASMQEKEKCLAREEREENSRRLAANERRIKDFLRELEEAREQLLESSKLSEMIDSLRQEITEKDKRIEAYEGKTNNLELAIDDLQNETRQLEDTVAVCKKVNKEIIEELETTINSSKESEARARGVDSLKHTIASQEEVLKTYKDHVAALETKLVLAQSQGTSSAESQEMQGKTAGNVPRRLHRSFVYVLNVSLASALMYFGTKKVLHKEHFQIDEQDINVVVFEKASIDHAVLPPESPGAADESANADDESANGRAKVEKFQLMKTGLRQVATHARRAAAHINANSYQKHIDESSFDALNTAGNAVRGFITDEVLNPAKIRAVVHDAAIAQAIASDGQGRPSSSAVSLSSPPSLPPWREIATSFVQATAQLGANLGSNNPMSPVMYEAYLFENTAVHPFAFDIMRSVTPNNRTWGYNHLDSRNGNLTLTEGCHCDWN
jgi:chromosome segregation ATPase